MSEKHENIEDFVRKVVDQSETQIPFNESHWQQMASMLDTDLPVVADPGVGYYYFSNVISILVGMVFLWTWIAGGQLLENPIITDQGTETEVTISDSESEVIEEVQPVEVQKEIASNNESVAVNSVVVEQSEEEKTEEQHTTVSGESASTAVLETNKETVQKAEKKAQINSSVTASERSNSESVSQASSGTIDDSPGNQRNSQETESPLSSDVEENNSISEKNENFIELADNDKEVVSYQYVPPLGKGIDFDDGPPKLPDQLLTVGIYDPDGGGNDSDNNPIVNRKSVRSSYDRFSVGISLSPDLSSNEVFRYNRLGRDLGITVDYWVTQRWSVSVGVFNTSKRYLVGGDEYSPPAGFWGNVTNGERPATIDADCQVLDIPINLKYRLVTRPNLNIYASAGVSSYIMLREDYQYELDNGWKSEWGVSNANQHFFGVGNLQVHFERRFGKSLAVEVAPFFKIPLTSYGHGNIRFHSMGSFFTLRKYFLNR